MKTALGDKNFLGGVCEIAAIDTDHDLIRYSAGAGHTEIRVQRDGAEGAEGSQAAIAQERDFAVACNAPEGTNGGIAGGEGIEADDGSPSLQGDHRAIALAVPGAVHIDR